MEKVWIYATSSCQKATIDKPLYPSYNTDMMNATEQTMNTTDFLYEELIYLDEIAGELDEESNAKIDARRKEILAEIREIERFCSRWG
jgi:hypothetical protein